MGAIDSRARFEEWIAKSYPDRDLEKHEDGRYAYAFASLAWEAWSAALTPPKVSDQNLLDLAATFETCIPFLPSAGQRNIGTAVAQLRHMAMGYVLVPVEPTEEMVRDGAESRPMRPFTPLEEWEAFEAMSGCEQGWHKARLCWAAMLAARPGVGR